MPYTNCPRCNESANEGMVYCPRCGERLMEVPKTVVKPLMQQDSMRAHYAGFWLRAAALIIDQSILGITVLIVGLVYSVGIFQVIHSDSVTWAQLSDDQNPVANAAVITGVVAWFYTLIVYFLGRWIYFSVMESSRMQGTLGKWLVGIRVTDEYGKRITFGRAAGRYFAKVITGMTFFVGYIMAGFTVQKQALHDVIASCLVVRKSYFMQQDNVSGGTSHSGM